MSSVLPLDGEFYHTPLPDEIIAAMERTDGALRSLAISSDFTPSYFIQHTLSWNPGTTVKVAFKGGSASLRQKIMGAVSVITDVANLEFAFMDAQGRFNEWTTHDVNHKGDIRICFDRGGYWSLVGMDSVNENIWSTDRSIGGHAGGRSMCFGGFESRLPSDYEHTVRHEFMHSIGFHHAHQSSNSNCNQAFRWEDDLGYVWTVDRYGRYINDQNGRRPGIYTYMSGAPNKWSRAKVNANMKPSNISAGQRIEGNFDARSIMLYRFQDFFYKQNTSNCRPIGSGSNLSDQDKEGLRILYPSNLQDVQKIKEFENNAAPLIAAMKIF